MICLAMFTGSCCDDPYVRKVSWTLRPYRLHAALTHGGMGVLALSPLSPPSERRLLISSHRCDLHNHTCTLGRAYLYLVKPPMRPMSTPLSRCNRGPTPKAVLGNEPVPHTVLTHGTHITAQPMGRVSTPTYERGVAKEVMDRTVHIPSSRF